MPSSPPLPLVYPCSGCSYLARLANDLALRLDRDGLAKMSCIDAAGVDVPSSAERAPSGRIVVAVDGCRRHCVQHWLAHQGVKAGREITLSDYGLEEHRGQNTRAEDFEMLYEELRFLLRTQG
ncbi:putative zinc-binding protein [Pseudomonas sp. GCEP-101]|uniref:putative zinc-binding protein n=1 Tax=Pseudomonas sp. GCEP-101 TaxID=2974552 RepID=UPI00223B5D03|nr:putative zinc-binding protein [Pseudomonas sp. GCEP-101]